MTSLIMYEFKGLTLLDKYLIYSEMLLLFEEGNPSGLCRTLWLVTHPERCYFQGTYPHISLFQLPELVKRKPEEVPIAGHWFKPFDNEPRIKILNEAIEDVLEQMDDDLDNY